MSCEVCRKAGRDHDKIVEACESSLYATARILCGYTGLSDNLHLPLCQDFKRALDGGVQRHAVFLPRGHFKTSLFSVAFSIWQYLRWRDSRILIVSASSKLAEEIIREIKGHLRSPVFQHFFPDVVPENPEVWNTSEILLNRPGVYKEATIVARGITSTIVGGKFTHHLLDDIVDNNISASPMLLHKVGDYVAHMNPLWADPKNGVRLMSATYWSAPIYDEILKSRLWRKTVLGCYVDERHDEWRQRCGMEPMEREHGDATPIFPERFTEQSLREAAEEMGSVKFSQQYMNIPVADDHVRFRDENLEPWFMWDASGDHLMIPAGVGAGGDDKTRKIPRSNVYITMTVDPATGETMSTDDTAVVVCGYLRDEGLIFVIDCWSGKALPRAVVGKIAQLVEKWRPRVVGIEAAGYQHTLKHWLHDELRKRGLSVRIDPLRHGNRSKADRIDGLTPFIESQQVYFAKLAGVKKLVGEALDYRVVASRVQGKSPNLLDAFAYHLDFWRRGGQLAAGDRARDRILPFDPDRDLDDERRGAVDAVPYGMACAT